MLQVVDEIILPKWVVTIDPDDTILADQAVAIKDGEILEIGQQKAIQEKYRAQITTHLKYHALMPGLINAHTHAAMSLFRGYADDMPLMQWLEQYIWPAETRHVSGEFVKTGTDLAMMEMIRSGTTCFNEMYFFPNVVARCVEDAGLRACLGMIVMDFPTVWANDADQYISKGLALKDEFRHSNLISWSLAPHAPYTISDEPLGKIATLAEEVDCQIHMHIHETAHEVRESVARNGMPPLERLDRLGLLGPRMIAVHMTQLLLGEIQTIKDRNINIVHCPKSNLKLASGFCPVHDLTQAGVNVAIGTDSASSNNNLDMLAEMQVASLLAKGQSKEPTAMDARLTLRCATLNGARALAMENRLGSIEVGKQADLIAIDLSGCTTEPVFSAPSQLVYSAGKEQVSHNWVAGKCLMRERQLLTLDEDKILQETRNLATKINLSI